MVHAKLRLILLECLNAIVNSVNEIPIIYVCIIDYCNYFGINIKSFDNFNLYQKLVIHKVTMSQIE